MISSFFSPICSNPDIHLAEFSTCGNRPPAPRFAHESALKPTGRRLPARAARSLARAGRRGRRASGGASGRIEAVGRPPRSLAGCPSGTPMYELPDALVTPGFVDGHTHFAMWALSRRRVQLAGAITLDEARAACGRRLAGAGMDRGAGLGRQRLGPARRTARRSMRCSAGRSISTRSTCTRPGSTARPSRPPASTRDTPDPFGGRIVRDAAGEPTGLLLERAVELMAPHLPEPPPDAAGRGPARGAGRGAPAGHHRHPRRRG